MRSDCKRIAQRGLKSLKDYKSCWDREHKTCWHLYSDYLENIKKMNRDIEGSTISIPPQDICEISSKLYDAMWKHLSWGDFALT